MAKRYDESDIDFVFNTIIEELEKGSKYDAKHIFLFNKSRPLIDKIISSWDSLSDRNKHFFCRNIDIKNKKYLFERLGEAKINKEIINIRDLFKPCIQTNLTQNSFDSKKFEEQEDEIIFKEGIFNGCPLLNYYCKNPGIKSPFKNKYVFFILHFLRDLIPFVEASKKLGLAIEKSYYFYKDYPYPKKEEIIRYLKEQGANVDSYTKINQYLELFAKNPLKYKKKILIIEDGGFIVPEILRNFSQLIDCVIGAVEQTTRGIVNAKKWEKEDTSNKIKFPLISVATSKLKREFEPPYIAGAVIDNIKKFLPNISFRGKKAGLLGFGAIGKKLAKWLKNEGMNLTIYDPNDGRKLRAALKGYTLAKSLRDVAKDKDFVIGASGYNAINSEVISIISHGTYLISASSEQYEIDLDELKRRTSKDPEPLFNYSQNRIGTTFCISPKEKKIFLLADGYPINFWGSESMPNEASDLILVLLLLSTIELVINKNLDDGINKKIVQKIAKHYGVAKKFLELHNLG